MLKLHSRVTEGRIETTGVILSILELPRAACTYPLVVGDGLYGLSVIKLSILAKLSGGGSPAGASGRAS